MKNILLSIIMAAVILLPMFAQADFSGSADITISANIPESDGYDSLINPGNVLGVEDIGMMSCPGMSPPRLPRGANPGPDPWAIRSGPRWHPQARHALRDDSGPP